VAAGKEHGKMQITRTKDFARDAPDSGAQRQRRNRQTLNDQKGPGRHAAEGQGPPGQDKQKDKQDASRANVIHALA